MTEYVLVHKQRPWTANAQRNMHYLALARKVKEWREAFWGLAKEAKVPALPSIWVTVQPQYKGGNRPDVGACYPAAKAAIDGLVDAKVIPDDDPDHLLSLTFLPAVMTADRDALVLWVEA